MAVVVMAPAKVMAAVVMMTAAMVAVMMAMFAMGLSCSGKGKTGHDSQSQGGFFKHQDFSLITNVGLPTCPAKH